MDKSLDLDNEITEEDFNKILDKRENEIYDKIFKKGGEIEDLMTDALKKELRYYTLIQISIFTLSLRLLKK